MKVIPGKLTAVGASLQAPRLRRYNALQDRVHKFIAYSVLYQSALDMHGR